MNEPKASTSARRLPAVSKVIFVRHQGFPRRWAALRRSDGGTIGFVTQEHERSPDGTSVFRYRAVASQDQEIGLFPSLRAAKEALTTALDA